MTLCLLVDMNLSPAWVEVLRNAGFEAEHWYQLGPHDAPDSELFGWARLNGYIVFTHDLDFGAMLNATQAESPSVFQIRTDDVSPEALSPRTIELLHRFTPQLLSGALVVVDEVRERVRVLPLRSVAKPQVFQFENSLRGTLAYNIRLLRYEQKISQEELAFRCELDRTYISAVERCIWNVSLSNIEKIAKALNIESWKLLVPPKRVANK